MLFGRAFSTCQEMAQFRPVTDGGVRLKHTSFSVGKEARSRQLGPLTDGGLDFVYSFMCGPICQETAV